MEAGGSIIVLVILVSMSAFFSATETAFLSFNKTRMKSMARQGAKRAQLVIDLEEQFDRLLTTILIGNNVVNILSSSLATVVFIGYFGDVGVTLSTVVMTVVILVFGEISPKALAKDHADALALTFAPIIKLIIKLFTPFAWLFSQWKRILTILFPSKQDQGMTDEELLTIVEEAEQEGGIDERESDLIRSAIEFNDQTAEDILTHRVDVISVDITDSMEEVEKTFRESGFSRLPVCEDNLDNVVGVIHEKDFYMNRNAASPADVMRPALFVTTGAKTAALLQTLQKTKNHMAIVTDEYGGTAGIITMEDIIEELIGDVYDEHDEILNPFRKQPDGSYLIDCSAELDEFAERFHVQGEFDSSTVGGWVIEQLEHIPEVGESFSAENLTATVTQVDSKRVIEIRIVESEAHEETESE